MDDFDKFQSYLIQEFRVITEPVVKQHMQELGETIWNDMFNLNGKKTIDRKLTEKEVFLGKVFYGYIEIYDSYNSLNDIGVYIGRFPYKNTNISKVSCIRYHIVNYMNETYVLSQRLSTYLTRIGKLYRQDRRHQEVIESTKAIFKIVRDSLSGIVKTRGLHVHKSRYKDEDIERLNLLDLFVREGGIDFLGRLLPDFYELEYKEIRRKWKKIIKQNNEALRQLFDIYFGALLKILFDRNGNLIYPQSIDAG